MSHHKALDLGGKGDVRIAPNGDVYVGLPDGSYENQGPVEAYTPSGKPSGRRGEDRDRRDDPEEWQNNGSSKCHIEEPEGEM